MGWKKLKIQDYNEIIYFRSQFDTFREAGKPL